MIVLRGVGCAFVVGVFASLCVCAWCMFGVVWFGLVCLGWFGVFGVGWFGLSWCV